MFLFLFANYKLTDDVGPTSGKGVVKIGEVGNEPWDYPAYFYREILAGMATGFKYGDPNFSVFPCALQAGKEERKRWGRRRRVGTESREGE